jgi:hypothetical protein
MSDQRTPEYDAERGQQAQRLLADPLLVETLDAIETKWTQAFQNSPARDVEGRELAYRMLQSARLFRQELEVSMDRGRVAQKTLAQRAGQTLRRAFGH